MTRRAIHVQAASIALAVAPFGLAFGVTAIDNGLTVVEAIGFSILVFSGSAQFAAVTVLGQGGTAAAAIGTGLLLNLRSLAFGLALAPALRGSRPWRALVSQLMIDESTAVATTQPDPRLRRYAFVVSGLAVFVTWNLATALGATAFSSAGSLVERLGIDATVPAVFLALLWPRIRQQPHTVIALAGATIALLAVPLAPAGVPILLAGSAVVLGRPWRPRREGQPR